MPITDEIIITVNDMAKKENQPSLIKRTPLFEWAPGLEIDGYDDFDQEEITSMDEDIFLTTTQATTPASYQMLSRMI